MAADQLRPAPTNPKTITPVEHSAHFAQSYVFQFELWAKGKKLALTGDQLVRQNLVVACSSKSPDLALKGRSGASPEVFICEVWFKNPQVVVSHESFTVTVSSEKSSYQLSAKVDLEVLPMFFVQSGATAIYTNKDRPEAFLQVRSQSQLDVDAGELSPFLRTYFHPSNHTQTIFVSVPKGYAKS